jgi:iron complex outermembrane receptor protein
MPGGICVRFLLVVGAFAFPFRAFAQSAREPGVITGTVRDSSGGAVPGATVRIIGESNRSSLDLVSNGEGVYRTTPLGPGLYRVETALDGFEAPAQRIALDPGQTLEVDITLTPSRLSEAVLVTARRVEEVAQEVPIPVSVVGGDLVEETGAFNVNRLKEQIPTVQFYSTNPRNSSVQIRGLGAPFGLTNDGIEPGVGLYIDGVFYARPAAATLDFLDVEQIEVLRGPQGTLFGKNTTAGAINVTSRKPSFSREANFELNLGDLDFVQAKGSVSGRLFSKVAGRISFTGTQRTGTLFHTVEKGRLNNLNNLGVRGQVLITPSDLVAITLSIDHSRQRPEGFTQVVAGVAPTLRPANRQYPQIAADLNYTAPSFNAFDRLTDVDTPMRSFQDLGGTALNIDWRVGPGRVTSTTAYRYWDWKPSNDRDFIGLPVTTVSAAPSYQTQLTQEVRYVGDLSPNLNIVTGAFVFHQALDSDPSFRQEQGSAAARFLLAPGPAASTPGLLDGYGFDQHLRFRNVSAAVFGQAEWSVTDRLRLLPGLRFNYDQKDVDFDQQVHGGLQTNDPALIALQRSIFAPQQYTANVADNNLSGQLTVAFKANARAHTYATYATSFKSVGLNLNGLPTDALGRPILSAATVKPEDVQHVEVGIKTTPFDRATANLSIYNTSIKDFQAQVVNADVGVLRGYLANAEKVRVRGVEFDGHARVRDRLTLFAAAAYSDGRYVSFPDAPPPLEDTGGPQVKDISGSPLPGISKWAVSIGSEHVQPARVLGRQGEFFTVIDASYRSRFSSSSTASNYLYIDGYALFNARVGFRWADGWSIALWSRNLFDRNYFELLSAAPGNTGLIVGQPGDARTFGVTLRVALRSPGN